MLTANQKSMLIECLHVIWVRPTEFLVNFYRLLENEIQIITSLLRKNGYPGWIIRNTTQNFLNKQTKS